MTRARVSSDVFAPRMISIGSIFSTGEKKWMPTKFSGRLTPEARSVIGSDEVLEPSTAPGSTMFSISANTLFFSSVFSNTASITKSTPVKSAASAVGVMRSSSARDFASVVRPFASAFCSGFPNTPCPCGPPAA